jgi:peptide/nickel transport system substrate-binding protein
LPEHIWSQVENPGEFENLEMIGSGPFKLSDYRQNEFVVLEAVKDHFLDSPEIDEVIFQYFDNPDVLVQALKTGQVDMLRTLPLTAVASLKEEENIEVVSGAPLTPVVRELHFNIISEEACPAEMGVCSGHPALKDPAVRLALAHAVDKQRILDLVQIGLGKPGVTLIPEGLGDFFNDQIADHAFDLELANQVLDEAGYLDTDGDGIREMPGGGQSLVFRVNWIAQDVEATRIAELVAPNWSQIGIETELAGLDYGVLAVRNFPEYDFDLMIGAWGAEPDPDLLLSTMATGSIPFGLNQSGYSNPEYDDLYGQQARELDRDARITIVHKMQEIAHTELPYIAFYYPDWVQAYRSDRFEGWPTNTGRLSLENRVSLSAIEPVK